MSPNCRFASLALRFSRHSLVVGRQRVRKWDDEKCVKFVADIMDGFFPAEFKKEFPDGVKLDLVDSRDRHSGDSARSFKGSGNSMLQNSNVKGLAGLGGDDYRPMEASEFLEMLPEKVVGESGQVHDIRGSIRERMSGVEAGVGDSEEESKDEFDMVASSKARNAADAAERRLRTGASIVGKAGETPCCKAITYKHVSNLPLRLSQAQEKISLAPPRPLQSPRS